MKSIQTTKAISSEFEQIYMMGFDVWADGLEADYLNECKISPKYKKGTWYVLKENDQLVSSLIVYNLGENIFGIGSIATAKDLRKKGYASKLITDVINQIETDSEKVTIFLYSDIDSKFYERFKFFALPALAQRYKTTTCMVRGQETEKYFADKFATPEYF